MTNKGWWVSVPVSMKLSEGTNEPRVEARKLLENCFCSINSNNSSNPSIEFDCSLQKTATGNGNLQPEIEINEYLSSKKLSLLLE